MAGVIAPPGDHTFPVALLDVKVTLPPIQNEVGPPAEMVGVGLVFTVTGIELDVPEHPFPLVTVTL